MDVLRGVRDGLKCGAFVLGNGLEFHEKELGMKTIAIFSKNRYEWLISDVVWTDLGSLVRNPREGEPVLLPGTL